MRPGLRFPQHVVFAMNRSSPPYAGSAPYEVEPDNVEKDAVLQDDIGVCDGSKKQRDGAIDGRRLMRRIDIALVPWLSFLYLLSFLDRVGIGNARVRGVFGISVRSANNATSAVRYGSRSEHLRYPIPYLPFGVLRALLPP